MIAKIRRAQRSSASISEGIGRTSAKWMSQRARSPKAVFFKDLLSHVGKYDIAVDPLHAQSWAAGRLTIEDVAADKIVSERELNPLVYAVIVCSI
ncbi:hypothetical protein [Mesorhizobium sp. M1342]|uniref:hypothetical protein n=1 Tax=Mesorhizobium sp. M1342 TaxID=2957088 RepID=UPI003335FAD6